MNFYFSFQWLAKIDRLCYLHVNIGMFAELGLDA